MILIWFENHDLLPMSEPCIISLLPHEGHKHVGKSVKGYVAICGMVMVEAKLRSLDLHRR